MLSISIHLSANFFSLFTSTETIHTLALWILGKVSTNFSTTHVAKYVDVPLEEVVPINYLDMKQFENMYLLWLFDQDDLYDRDYSKLRNADHGYPSLLNEGTLACMKIISKIIGRRKRPGSNISHTSDEEGKSHGTVVFYFGEYHLRRFPQYLYWNVLSW